MKLDAIEIPEEHRTIVRLYAFSQADIRALWGVIGKLERGELARLELDAQPWIEAIGGFKLALVVSADGRELVKREDGSHEWRASAGRWGDVAGRVHPFAPGQFQWLDECEGASMLLSGDGMW